MTLEQRPPGRVAVTDGGRVALVRDAEGALSLPEVPGWNGQAWRYRRDLAAARSAGHALPDALAAPLTHLTPLDGGGEDGAPVALAEPMEGAVRAEAWWSPGNEPPAGLSATALRALDAAFDRAPSWPPYILPGATGMIAELAAGEPALAGRFGAHEGAMTQEQAWALSSVWRDDEVVLKLTNPAWPAEAAITSLLARLAPTHVPAVLAAGSHRGVPFLEYDVEIRRVICTTNAIESINARYRRAVRARGHFPNEQAALKCLYLVTRSLDPTGGGRARWVIRWKPALNAFAITFVGRFERTTH